jgi:hypothetical protein
MMDHCLQNIENRTVVPMDKAISGSRLLIGWYGFCEKQSGKDNFISCFSLATIAFYFSASSLSSRKPFAHISLNIAKMTIIPKAMSMNGE